MKKPRILHLGRPVRTVRNLLIAMVLLVPIWAEFGYPVPTIELASALAANRALLASGEVAATHWELEDTHGISFEEDGHQLRLAVRETGGQAVVYWQYPWQLRGRSHINVFPLEEGPSPVPLIRLAAKADEAGQPQTGNALLFLYIPEEAAWGEVTVTGRVPEQESDSETVQGHRGENGLMSFWFGTGMVTGNERRWLASEALLGRPYTLRLYRADGSVLAEQEGTIPGLL